MKKILLLILLSISITSCGANNNISNSTINEITSNNINESETSNMIENKQISVTINEKEYKATLENNETTKEFIKILPQEYNMNELNGNEKYIYLNESLPTNEYNPMHINAGDIMLFGNNCLVIFYKSFDTNYSYTKIGHISNLPQLDNNNINVKIESKEDNND